MLKAGDERYLTGDGQLRTPLGLIFLLLFFLRGYLAWIISLTFSEDRTRLLQFFYTSTEQFGLALLVGLPALFTLVLLTQIKAEIPGWVKAGARIAPLALWLSWVIDGVLLLSLISARWPEFSVVKAFLVFGWLIALWILLFSRHLRRFWELLSEE